MKKVGAYCRISTDKEDQKNSLESQRLYFEKYIMQNEDWEFVGIFADEGISGTSLKKRKRFNEMIDKARKGGIDLIITKEVSRFARNTVDTLQLTRELKKKSVGVIFINDNINTLDTDGELRLTIMASIAQEESRKTSERVSWGMLQQAKRGYVFGTGVFGFHLKMGVLTVNEEEAPTVRRIFQDFLSGKGISTIGKDLKRDKIPCGKNRKTWNVNNIRAILADVKQMGDYHYRQTRIEDHLEHKAIRNDDGEQVYIENHHQGNVSKEIFEQAQMELQRRAALSETDSRHSSAYWASGIVKCGECGSSVISRNKYNKDGSFVRFWYCKEIYNFGKECGCDSNLINDTALLTCVQTALKRITFNAEGIRNELRSELAAAKNQDCSLDSRDQYRDKIQKALEKKDRIIDMYAEGEIDKAELNRMKEKYDKDVAVLAGKIKHLEIEMEMRAKAQDNLFKTLSRIEEILNQDEPTPEFYRSILEKVVLFKNHDLDIYFKHIAKPIRLHYETSGRKESYHVECTFRTEPETLAI
jgi:DNA invertase Pin-like site-specific DNA recombinase